MPIPNPKQFKDKESFISKCMEIEIGSGKDNEQSYAICNTTWDNRNMSTQQRRTNHTKSLYFRIYSHRIKT